MSGNETWFIPDGRNLHEAFNGIVPLLSFTLGEQKRLEPLLDKLGIWDKHLSGKVTKQEVVDGKDQATKDITYTRKFQVKAHYLLCLTNPAERYMLKPLLESIEFWAVKSIEVHRSVRIDNQEIRGRPLAAHVMLDKDHRVYVPSADLEENELNYYELSEKLTTLCKLEKVPKELPFGILSMSSTGQIEDMLEEHGVIFDKLELRKLTNKIVTEPAGAVLSSRCKTVEDDPPEMVTDAGTSDSGDSDLSSLAALKDLGVRVKLARKPKPAIAPCTNGQNRNGRVHFGREPSTDNSDSEQQSADGDWDKDSVPTSTGGAPSRRPGKNGHGTGHRMRLSYFESGVAMSDEEINDIDNKMSENGIDMTQRAQASEYRKQLNAVENAAEDPQVIRIGEQGETKVSTLENHLMALTESCRCTHSSRTSWATISQTTCGPVMPAPNTPIGSSLVTTACSPTSPSVTSVAVSQTGLLRGAASSLPPGSGRMAKTQSHTLLRSRPLTVLVMSLFT